MMCKVTFFVKINAYGVYIAKLRNFFEIPACEAKIVVGMGRVGAHPS